MLGLGASLNGSQIKEGDDVYFECRVRFVTFPWRHSCISFVFVLVFVILWVQKTKDKNTKRQIKEGDDVYTLSAAYVRFDNLSSKTLTPVLLYFFIYVLLYFFISVLLHFCTSVFLYICIFASGPTRGHTRSLGGAMWVFLSSELQY